MAFKDFLNDMQGHDAPDGVTWTYPMKSQAKYVEFGYGQVEPNHLSAQRNGQIYAQLPANPEIEILEQGQFAKYDYAANENGIGEVNFEGKGEWMLVYNEIKLYRRHPDGSKQWDCEFAMLKDDYQARIYSPYDWEHPEHMYKSGMHLNGVDGNGKESVLVHTRVELNSDGHTVTINGEICEVDPDALTFTYNETEYTLEQRYSEKDPTVKIGLPFVDMDVEYKFDDVTKDVRDLYEFNFTNDPFQRLGIYAPKKMRPNTSMVPRLFKTMVGDIFTTNTIDEEELAIGDELSPRAEDGILCKSGDGSMLWQVVRLYTMPDGQKGVKLMRIA